MRARHVRIVLFLLALATTAAWAYSRMRARTERTRWEWTVRVLVYVLGETDADALAALRRSLDAMSGRLAEDLAALGPGPEPFRFELVGPLAPARLPPIEPPDASFGERLAFSLALWRAERAVREVAPEPDPDAYDIRVYLIAAPGGTRSFAEGVGAAGGEVGVVRASLEGDALLAASAIAHEALHALGASDKYDAGGHAVEPAGLVEPDREPRYPQARAEIMVGEVPLEPGHGRLPENAGEIGIGPVTAAEIGWPPQARK